MGFRFYRRIRILPGLRLNVSGSGVSTSIGRRGAWLTFGKRGTTTTVGLPGTGLRYTETYHAHPAEQPAEQPATPFAGNSAQRGNGKAWRGWLWIALIIAVVAWALLHR